jgi:MFS family permease
MVQKTVKIYYAFVVLFQLGISFIAAMYVMFLLSHGLNLFEVNLVNFVFFTTLLLFEVPTGVIADTFGRKTSYVLACLGMSLSMLVYGLSNTFIGFVVAEVIGAIAATLASGAFQAWFVDRIRFFGYKGELDHFFAREQIFKQGAIIVGAVSGAVAADYNLAIPWFLGALVFAGTGIAALIVLKEEYFKKTAFSIARSIRMIGNTLRTSVQYGLKNGPLRFVLIMGMVQYIALQAPNMQWQPFLSQYFESRTSLGFIFAGISLSIALGALLSKRIRNRMRHPTSSLIVAQMAIGVGIIGTVLVPGIYLVLLIFLAHEFARGVYRPLKDAYLNSHIPSAERATLLSFDSMGTRLGGMIGLLMSGYLAQSVSIPSAWIISGSILIIGTVLVARKR